MNGRRCCDKFILIWEKEGWWVLKRSAASFLLSTSYSLHTHSFFTARRHTPVWRESSKKALAVRPPCGPSLLLCWRKASMKRPCVHGHTYTRPSYISLSVCLFAGAKYFAAKTFSRTVERRAFPSSYCILYPEKAELFPSSDTFPRGSETQREKKVTEFVRRKSKQ